MSKLLVRLLNQAGATAGLVGALVLLQLGLLRALTSATTAEVFVAGHKLGWGCWFKERFGIPCPMCGMTRSVLLTLHGQVDQAWHLNPAGVVFLVGLVLFTAAMFLLMVQQQTHARPAVNKTVRQIRIWTTAYGAMFVAVLLLHWVVEVSRRM